jgi:hypothetical protein
VVSARESTLRGQWSLASPKTPEDIARGLGYPYDIQGAFTPVPTDLELVHKMMGFDTKFQPQKEFKFGVVYCMEGQVCGH